MEDALKTKEQTDLVLRTVDEAFLNIRQMDISSRGYAIMMEDRFLYWSLENARNANLNNFLILDSLFRIQNYSDPENYRAVKSGFNKYVDIYEDMIYHLKNDDLEAYKAILIEDYGKLFFEVNDRFTSKLRPFEAALLEKAERKYENAILRNTIVQLLLLFIGLPTLIFILFTLYKEENARKKLLIELRENNKQYIFDDGNERLRGISGVLKNSIKNFKKAASFVNEVSKGNYDVQWKGLNQENEHLNKENLVGQLVNMKQKMRAVDEDNNKRIWLNEGISKLSEIIRNSERDIDELSYNATKYLCDTLNSQQAGLFIYHDDEDSDEQYLALSATYAFDRRKHVDKRVEIGQGLVGQAFKENDTILLTEIPQKYHHITSGLGDATPTCIIVVPMRYNEKIQAIIEMASFEMLEPYMIEFLERSGEYIASAIATAKNNKKTSIMVEQLQQQTEEMRAQEEELRQNMEELEATQEEMRRKEQRMEEKLRTS